MINNVFFLLIYISLAFILLFQVKYQPNNSDKSFFGRANSLRGFFALEIVLGHCVRYDHCLLTPLGNFMLISVGFFFFVSGFGLARSYHSKQNYMKSFFSHRILHLFTVALLGLVFTTIIAFILPVKTDFSVIPNSFAGILSAIQYRTNWYIRELLILYILFYAVYRFSKATMKGIYKLLILTVSIVAVCVVLYYLGYTRCWFSSVICFPLGIAFYEYYDRFTAFLLSLKGKIIATLLLLCGLGLSLLNYPGLTGLPFEKTEMLYALANTVMCVGFTLILSTVLLYFETGNIVLNFLTKRSTELYLFQFVLLTAAEQMEFPVLTKIAFVVILDILVSTILHPLFKRLR